VTLEERYDRILERMVAELRRLYGERLISCAVFGSVGRGAQREDSDVDVLLVVRALPEGRFARVEEFLPVEEHLEADLRPTSPDCAPVSLCPVFKTPEEVEAGSPLFLDMVEDARILHDRDDFFAGYLGRLHSRLKALGARRIWLGNAWYWELKPDLRPGEVFQL